MPRKVSRRMLCAFCGRGTEDASGTIYLEMELTNPDNPGSERQLFGAHSSCLANVMTNGFEVDTEHLMGR